MFGGSEIHVFRVEAGHDLLNEREVILRCAVLDQHQRLSSGIDLWAVQRVYRNNADILGQMILKSRYLGSLARSLTTDNRSNLGRCAGESVHGGTRIQGQSYKDQRLSQRHQCSLLPRCR